MEVVISKCRDCSWRRRCGYEEMLGHLRSIGMLTKQPRPDEAIVVELFYQSLDRFSCPACASQGFLIVEADDDGDWPEARTCENCGVLLDPDRVELFPDTTFCAACQSKAETGKVGDDREFCEYCGGVVQVTSSRSPGLSRYVMRCSDCGR